MSWRTRDAIASLDIPVPDHRSRQATVAELDNADLVIALAREHVHVDAARAPDGRAAHRDAEAPRARSAAPAPARCGTGSRRCACTRCALEPWEDVVDPAGGDLDVFLACAREIADLLHELIPRLALDSARCRAPTCRSDLAVVAASRPRRHTALVLQEVQNGVVGSPSVLPALAEAAAAVDLVAHCAQLARAARAVGRHRRALHRGDARRRQGRQPQRPAVPRREASRR